MENEPSTGNKMQLINMKNIKSLKNIRTDVNQGLIELMQSIKQSGLLVPLMAYKDGNDYILIHGNRRFAALKKLGFTKLEVGKQIILNDEAPSVMDFISMNASENEHREAISPAEFAKACKLLKQQGLNIPEIACRLSVPRTRIETALRISQKVPEGYENDVGYAYTPTKRVGKISASAANAITQLRVKQDDIDKLFKVAKDEELTCDEIRVIDHLVRGGEPIMSAMKKRKKFIRKSIMVAINKSELDKYPKMTATQVIVKMVRGELAPNRKLIVWKK